MTAISSIKVNRDQQGMFTHPDFPLWDEETPLEVITSWFSERNATYKVVSFEDDAEEELIENWFSTGNFNCLEWEPTCSKAGSFLLSIHDTENGPIAIFFVPK